MTPSQAVWSEWLAKLPADQRLALESLVLDNADLSTRPAEVPVQVKVTRIPTAELYVRNPPLFVDTNLLHAIYDRVAFRSNLLIKGPKGEGKSVSIFSWAARNKIPLVMVECSEDTKKYDLQGSQFLIGNDTVYVLGGIPTAIDVANEVGRCILLFEEVNALTPQVQKQLNAITDFRKESSLPHIGKSYKLREGAHIWPVMTMNPVAYGGTYDLNEDLKSRLEEIEVGYPQLQESLHIVREVCGQLPNINDQVLEKLARFCQESRQKATSYALSTRDLVRMVQSVSLLGLDTALQLVICKFEGEDRKTMMARLASQFGPNNKIKSYWGSPT